VFLDMMAGSNHLISQLRTEQVASPLQRLYQIVNESVKRMQTGNGSDRVVIMVDDASLLEVWAGGRSDQVLAFLHYCRAIHSNHHVRFLFLPFSCAGNFRYFTIYACALD
jgi:hypothetical protein